MLREEQIDIRRKRAAAEGLKVQNLGRNRVFSDYQVTNPRSGGQYRVSIRGFDVGDNSCDCPDFRANTLGTCKHIEAVLDSLKNQLPPSLQRKKAAITHPEIFLHYGEQLQVGLHLPPRCSDMLRELADTFFDLKGYWKGDDYEQLIHRVEQVPEQVTIFSDAIEFMDRELERREMAGKEGHWLQAIQREEPPSVLFDLLKVPLYPYQLRGAIFAACRGRCILGDDMGLGKTVQTLAAAEILARERGIERVLVIAPASVKYQWETEVRKYTPRDVQVIEGGSTRRRAQYAQPTFYRLINYEIAVRDRDELNAWHPDLIVLDEAQRIKNWESKTSRAVKKLRSRYALVLTGTPLENKLEELYSIVQFVDDRRLGPAFQFLHDHRVLDHEGRLIGYRNLEMVRERLAPIFLRRTRAEVLSQLPSRTDTTIWAEMTEPQRLLYGEHQNNLARLLQKKYLGEMERRRILASLTNMRMACNSTFLLDGQTNVSPKLEELEELLTDLLGHGEANKVVIFSQWETMLRLAEEVVRRRWPGYALLHGGVPGPQRRELLDRFRDDPACKVFLSTDAGGTGLNLQTADTVINLEVPWNPAVLEQRVARVHRMGQHNPVHVFHFVTRDSIEERILAIVAQKKALFDEVFSGSSDEISLEGMGHQAFLDTMRELFSPPEPEPEPEAPRGTGVPPVQSEDRQDACPTGPAPSPALFEAGIHFVEALAVALAEGGDTLRIALPPTPVLERGVRAMEQLLSALRRATPPASAPAPPPEDD